MNGIKLKNNKITNMTIDKVLIETIKMNPNNPRIIKDDKFKKLVKSIKEFPEMLEIRPIVVDDNGIVLGGNMRLKACREAGLKEVHVIKASELTEDQKKEFIVKDNVGYGEWDFDMLLEDWNKEQLEDWGLDIDIKDSSDFDGNYTRKIEAPIYEIKGIKPDFDEMVDDNKYNELINEIENSDISEDDKKLLKLSASRHIVLNFENIAEYYSHSDKKVQELMEKQAMVIIDFDKAIELGFVNLSNDISNIFLEDYEK